MSGQHHACSAPCSSQASPSLKDIPMPTVSLIMNRMPAVQWIPDLAGMDATVYFPLVDFKFRNDTSSWLLMETYVDVGARSLTWKLYSTSDGRSVTWETTGPTNVVPAPEPIFEENPDLKKNQIKQVDWAAQGADVYVTRTVWINGQIYFTDPFTTHYQPWQAICQYGPDTDTPKKQAKEKGLCLVPQT